MAEERERSEWNRTAAMMSLFANAHRDKGKSFKPNDFNPYTAKQTDVQVPWKELRSFFEAQPSTHKRKDSQAADNPKLSAKKKA